jgi:hypothetical protein
MPVDDHQLQQAETFSLLQAIWTKLQQGRRIHSYQVMQQQQQQQQDLSTLCLAGYVHAGTLYSVLCTVLLLLLTLSLISRFDPLSNAKGQNPCQVARILADTCLSGPRGPHFYPLYQLAVDQDQDHYAPPTGAQQSPCVCSSAL